MKNLLFVALLLIPSILQAEVLYPGRTTDIEHRATSGDHSPSWSTTNPTLQLSSVGFLCHVKAQAYFSGTATVTCSYDTYIGSTKYEHKKSWTFTCVDARASDTASSRATSEAGGYYDWDSTGALKITLEEPGTLGDSISESEKYTITNIAIAGPLNGADLRLLRDMAGDDCESKVTKGKLEVIDLKDAVFVSGGPWHFHWGSDDYSYTTDTPEFPRRAFFKCKNIKRLRFPKYCTVVSNLGTQDCSGLEQLAIPPGITEIDGSCLNSSKDVPMQTLTVPSSVQKIKSNFFGYDNLTDIYCYAVEPPLMYRDPVSNLGSTNISNGTLYVPKGCADAYWRAEGWRSFKNIKETLDIFNTLYIQVGEHGSVKFRDEKVEMTYPVPYAGHQAFEVQEDENVEVEVNAHEGYALARVLLNDEELTLPEDSHIIKIGKLSGISTLKVEFEERASVEMIEYDAEEPVDVYNANGVLLKSGIKKDVVKDMPAGLYIIRGKKGALKIAVR